MRTFVALVIVGAVLAVGSIAAIVWDRLRLVGIPEMVLVADPWHGAEVGAVSLIAALLLVVSTLLLGVGVGGVIGIAVQRRTGVQTAAPDGSRDAA